MTIEHTPWLPTISGGIDGQKVAIVGFSHHRRPSDPDNSDFTHNVVKQVIDGQIGSNSFFSPVRSYFGFENDADFWQRVMFFNFLPNCVGVNEQKYGRGTPEQIRRGKARAEELLRKHKPDKVFVFSTKAWRDFPETIQEKEGRPCTPLVPGLQRGPSWGAYKSGEQRALACGFRHPQFANAQVIRSQVERFLKLN